MVKLKKNLLFPPFPLNYYRRLYFENNNSNNTYYVSVKTKKKVHVDDGCVDGAIILKSGEQSFKK